MSYAEMQRKRHSNDEGIDRDLPLELAVGVRGERAMTSAGRTPRCITRGDRDAKLGLLKLFSVAISEQQGCPRAWKTS